MSRGTSNMPLWGYVILDILLSGKACLGSIKRRVWEDIHLEGFTWRTGDPISDTATGALAATLSRSLPVPTKAFIEFSSRRWFIMRRCKDSNNPLSPRHHEFHIKHKFPPDPMYRCICQCAMEDTMFFVYWCSHGDHRLSWTGRHPRGSPCPTPGYSQAFPNPH